MTSSTLLNLTVWLLAAMVAAQPPQTSPRGTASQEQPPGPPGGRGGGQGRGGPAAAFPARVVDPAMVERGRAIYSTNCTFCHGQDTRGGEGGPSLLRSQLVQDDRNGETIAPVVRGGQSPPMPAFTLTDVQMADLAAFLHSFQINSRDPARMRPTSVLTGDAKAGEAYFAGRCASCHSGTRNLSGIAARFSDPRALQQWWLMPGGGGRGRGAVQGAFPITATVTPGNGQKYEGRLVHLDEFTVSILDQDGATRSFERAGDAPKIDVHDPLQGHKALLRTYTDKDIHDVTAYLETLK